MSNLLHHFISKPLHSKKIISRCVSGLLVTNKDDIRKFLVIQLKLEYNLPKVNWYIEGYSYKAGTKTTTG